jgi:hypothetical protein
MQAMLRAEKGGTGLLGIFADGNEVAEGFAKVALQGLGALPGDVRAELRLSGPATRRSSALPNRQRRRGVPPPDLFPRLLLVHQTYTRRDRKSHTMNTNGNAIDRNKLICQATPHAGWPGQHLCKSELQLYYNAKV